VPDLATALSNLGLYLGGAGQFQAAVAPAREAAGIYRKLADLYLPGLATALIDLGRWLDETGQRSTALASIQEAVGIYHQLAAANPDAYLPSLAIALSGLSGRLAEVGREAEASGAWESAIADLPEEPAKLSLSVAYAYHLLGQPSPKAGVELLISVLATPGLPGQVEANARSLLRHWWRREPQAVEQAWQSAISAGVPGWLHLTDHHIGMVSKWINADTAADSHRDFHRHADQLLVPVALTVLDELALILPESLIRMHRGLLEAGREGTETIYRALLLGEILDQWLAVPDWDASRVFLHEHPELLADDIHGIFANLAGDPSPKITVCQALVTLARTSSGADGAYRSLQHEPSVLAIASAAIAGQDSELTRACAQIEMLVHGRIFMGMLHMILARLFAYPGEQLPESWVNRIQALVSTTGTAEKDAALMQFSDALASIPADSATTNQLRRILGLPD
jgi:tetratricopeptide (TPR) repeat protein